MVKALAILAFLLFGAWPQAHPKYPWQEKDTNCNSTMSFCWYGSDVVKDPEVLAYGNRWESQDKGEKLLEWVTEVRCIQTLHRCILARNQKVSTTGGTLTNIDLYYIQEWNEFQIRAVGESDFAPGHECEVDSLLLNREDASVSMLSVPGSAATTKRCAAVMKPKTVMYRLEN